MTKDEALQIVLTALQSLNEELDQEQKITISPDTPLFGSEAAIDSLSLVSLIVDVEETVSERAGQAISLTDDRALAQPISPFSNPDILAEYISTSTHEV